MMRRLLTIALLLAGSSAWAQNDFIRFRKPSVAGAESGGATFTAPVLFPNGSAAAPAISWSAESNSGWYRIGTTTFELSLAGFRYQSYNANGITIGQAGFLGFDATTPSLTPDTRLYRDGAANTLALRNGTSGQSFFVYNTISGSNYERGALKWDSNIFYVGPEKGGSGTQRDLYLQAGTYVYLYSGGATATWNSLARFYSTDDVGELGVAGASWKGLNVLRYIQGSKSKTLTDNTATAFVRLTVADDDYEGCDVIYTAYAEDADTDARQVRHGRHQIAILNNSGTEACNVSTGDSGILVTAGTFTCTLDCAAGTNTVDLRATCDTSLDAAAETLTFEYRLDCPSTLTVTPQ